MLNRFKILKKELDILKSYIEDYFGYRKWQYNNSRVKTQNALEAQILREAHILEKGMSISNPRRNFGVNKAVTLLELLNKFKCLGFSIEKSSVAINSIGILHAYIRYHAEQNFFPSEVINKFSEFKGYCLTKNIEFGVKKSTSSEIKSLAHNELPEFLKNRHSIRQYSNIKVNILDVKKAVSLAMTAPSACNRQTCKVYYYESQSINNKLGKIIAGNTGFDDEVQNYLIVTSDISAFYDSFERNQCYVDGGIFTMVLVEALHYYGVANCILQNGEYRKNNNEIKKICGNIPENEKIILFIAIGYYKENFTYAISNRKNIEKVLILK